MAGRLAVVLALLLAACGSSQASRPATPVHTPGDVVQAAVGSRMVDRTNTAVTVTPMVPKPRVNGSRTEFVYLGLLGSDPVGRSTIRVRYAEYRIENGVTIEPAGYRAEVTLDLSQARVLEFKGWRIGVLEATDASIRYEVIGSPAP
jgi:hypothetical protein